MDEMDKKNAGMDEQTGPLDQVEPLAAPVTSALAPDPPPVALTTAMAAPARRWGALGVAALVALGAVLGGAAGTAMTYRALQGEIRRAAGLRVTGEPVVAGRPIVFSGEVNVARIYKQAAPAVVEIRSVGSRRGTTSSGTGFIFDGRGYILTNYHVVDGASSVRVILEDGTELAGKVLGSDPSNDLAVVSVDPRGRTLPVLPLGDSDAVEPGEPAIAIGFPLGEGKSVTAGIVSGKNRASDSPAGWRQVGMIQTDAALNPGNSGGPLLNAAGQVIGINAQAVSRGFGGIGLAVPINTARRLLPDMIAGVTVQHPWLGISGGALSAQAAETYRLPVSKGIVVNEVMANSPAQAAGLQGMTQTYSGDAVPGDIITAVDGRPVASVEELSEYLMTRRPGDRVVLTVWRSGKEVTLTVTLQARPASLNQR